MQRKYGENASFLTIYIKEAHPEDEWQMDSNEEQGVCYPQPKTLEQRVAIARDFVERHDYELPLLVDPIENPARAVLATPLRLAGLIQSGPGRGSSPVRVRYHPLTRRCAVAVTGRQPSSRSLRAAKALGGWRFPRAGVVQSG